MRPSKGALNINRLSHSVLQGNIWEPLLPNKENNGGGGSRCGISLNHKASRLSAQLEMCNSFRLLTFKYNGILEGEYSLTKISNKLDHSLGPKRPR